MSGDVEYELPDGWCWASIGDLTSYVQRGKSPKYAERSELPVVNQKCVRWEGVQAEHLKFIDRSQWSAWAPERSLRGGDILWNSTGTGTIGRAAIYRPLDGFARVVADSHVTIVRVNAGAPDYVHAWIRSPAVQGRIDAMQTGSTNQVELARTEVLRTRVPIAPLNEQRRIVAKLEALQARSRRAREALDAVSPLLEKLRQSILAAAFRGDLTKDWRARHPDIVSARAAIESNPQAAHRGSGRAAAINVRPGKCAISVGDPKTSVPRGWCWTSLLRVARMESGHTPSRAVEHYWGGAVPWVSIPDARDHNGAVIETTTSTVTEAGLANSAARLLPPGTVCLVRTAASIGYVTVLGREMATSQDFANWVCGKALLPKYLMYALWAERDAIRSYGEGSAHPTVYFPELKAFHVKLAPPAEQRVIVETIERRLATLDRLREQSRRLSLRHERLEPSFLSKAFRGELVPQNPNDEPAEVMLARMRGANGATRNIARAEKGKRERP